MKKMFHRNYAGEKVVKGIKEEVYWKSTSYHKGPRDSGCYTVSNGDGTTFDLFYTGSHDYAEELFKSIMHEEFREGVIFHDSNARPSNDDLIALYTTCGVWYDVVDGPPDGDGYCDTQLVIYKQEEAPKYFLERPASGPIEADVDSYEEEFDDSIE